MNKVALITGGTEGIGKALVESLSKDFEKIYTCSRSAENHTSGNTTFTQCDVSKPDEVDNLVNEIVRADGQIDTLINNAGLYHRALIEEESDSSWEAMISVNLNGSFYFCNRVIPIMKKNNFGRIINVCSGVIENPLPARGAYAASKAALTSLTKTISKEVEEFNIKANGICPGLVSTKMDVDKAAKRGPEKIVKFFKQLIDIDENGPNGKFYRFGKELNW